MAEWSSTIKFLIYVWTYTKIYFTKDKIQILQLWNLNIVLHSELSISWTIQFTFTHSISATLQSSQFGKIRTKMMLGKKNTIYNAEDFLESGKSFSDSKWFVINISLISLPFKTFLQLYLLFFSLCVTRSK